LPKNGDKFTVKIQPAHLNWGTHRYTSSRNTIYGEGYIQIPRSVATNFNILNSNASDSNNIYICSSADGFLNQVQLKAAGSSTAGDIYAKQFQGNGSLKTIGAWYQQIQAKENDLVHILFTSPKNILITHEASS